MIGCALAVLAAGCERQSTKAAHTGGSSSSSLAAADATTAGDSRSSDGANGAGGGRQARNDGPTYKDGKPTWAANRNHTSEENVDYQFKKNGSAFGASSAEAYVAKVHAFLSDPPAGVQSVTRARNGDKLYYDAKSNTLVVANRDGAPRTMFKPTGDGKAYWAEQQASASEPRSAGRRRSSDGGGSNDNG